MNIFKQAFNKVLVQVTSNKIAKKKKYMTNAETEQVKELKKQTRRDDNKVERNGAKYRRKLMESQSQKEILSILRAQEKKMNLLQGQINDVERKLEEIEQKMNNLAKDFDMTKQNLKKNSK